MGTTLETEVKSGNRKGRPNYPVEFKRRLAVAACEPGVSVAKIALEHQINTNMVFKWRRELRAGLLDIDPRGAPALLPVTVASVEQRKAAVQPPPSILTPSGSIEIVIADALIRVRGDVDTALLRSVIESLRT